MLAYYKEGRLPRSEENYRINHFVCFNSLPFIFELLQLLYKRHKFSYYLVATRGRSVTLVFVKRIVYFRSFSLFNDTESREVTKTSMLSITTIQLSKYFRKIFVIHFNVSHKLFLSDISTCANMKLPNINLLPFYSQNYEILM